MLAANRQNLESVFRSSA